MNHLCSSILVLPLTGKGYGESLAAGVLSCQNDRWVLHGDLGSDVAIDPLHGCTLMGNCSLGYQVVNVVRPVLDCGVADPCVFLNDDLDNCAVQRVGLVDRSRAALDVVNIGVFVGNDERPLKLAHVLCVNSEIGLQRNLDLYALGNVDEGST